MIIAAGCRRLIKNKADKRVVVVVVAVWVSLSVGLDNSASIERV